MKFHTELMVKTSHDLDFLYDAFLSFILRIRSFFRKCFHSEATTVLKFLSKINRSEVTFSDFLLGFKLFMEPSLIDFSFKNLSACLKVSFVSKDILGLFLLFFETDADWGHWKREFEIKVKDHSLTMFRSCLYQTFIVKRESGISFCPSMSRTWKKESARVGNGLRTVHWCDCFHS